MKGLCKWLASWIRSHWWQGTQIHQSGRCQHHSVVTGALGLGLAEVAVMAPVGYDVGMQHVFWLCMWYLNWFQGSRHIVRHGTGTWLCLHELLGVLSTFLQMEWWVLCHKGWCHNQLWSCYGQRGCGISILSSGHPVRIVSARECRRGSLEIADLNCLLQ